jgi:hypothetical protein
MGPELRESGAGSLESDLSHGSSGAGSLESDLSYGRFRRGVVGMGSEPLIGGAVDGAGEQSQRPTTREAVVVATEAEIDRVCGEWIGFGVGDAGGSETRPHWRIGVEEVARAPRPGKPGRNKAAASRPSTPLRTRRTPYSWVR